MVLSLNVAVDDRAVMSFTPVTEQGPVDWSHVPQSKAIQEVIQKQYTLPPIVVERVKNHVFYNESCVGRTMYCLYGSVCCCLPFCICGVDHSTWDNERDVDLVRQEVVKLLNSIRIEPEAYKIDEFGGSTEAFTGSRNVLRLHFNDPNVHEL
ncbi:unnamed protein product [Ostreobium quekettii]|uniref:Uncharacterized protein n=1 Tax=Ostreobium quekettii TaxID=121088 RepID=A0A8S1J2Z4_9CHLO|nr:unnamed protein product [Ostreobium quekettii]|eukprot:evm.model.scf_358EXC.1 EVM.evm.TU.scf_358EXC.1   scf_358EXC:11818-14544(-)